MSPTGPCDFSGGGYVAFSIATIQTNKATYSPRNQKSKTAAEKFIDAWCRRAEASGIQQILTMAKTHCTHRRGLLHWYDHPLSTGPLEGINNKIGALQRRAHGSRNYDHLKEKLLTLHQTKFIRQG